MTDKRASELLSENLTAIYGYAFSKLYDKDKVEDLASEIIYEIITSVHNLQNDEAFWGFAWKIAENTFRRFIRRAEFTERNVELTEENIGVYDFSPEHEYIQKETESEEIYLLRRELSLLKKTHREVCVAYYVDNKSCSQIAKEQNISVEMVKYHLFKTRKLLKEGIGMTRTLGEKSYRPNIFEIDFWGTKAGDDHEYRDFQRRKIKGNILLATYYSPITIQEISMELGVALPYLEDEIKLLVDRQYLVYNNGKYLTNIPIFTLDCTNAIDGKLKELTEESAQKFVSVADEFAAHFENRFANTNLAHWQKLILCLHYSLIDTEHDLEKNYGELPKDGPYSLVNGGGGHGIIWGRSSENVVGDKLPRGIQGIYNGCPSSDKRGSVIAMNFRQTLNAQHFEGHMTDPVVCTAVDCFEYLPKDWQKVLNDLHYAKDEKANFAVWSSQEYDELQQILNDCISIVSDLNRKTSEIAANITADLLLHISAKPQNT